MTKKKKAKPHPVGERWSRMLNDPTGQEALKEFRIAVKEAKKTKKKVKPVKKKTVKPHRDLYHLTMLLKYTERNIVNDGSGMDELFKNQAMRLRKQLEDIK